LHVDLEISKLLNFLFLMVRILIVNIPHFLYDFWFEFKIFHLFLEYLISF
jgi:hypothetical protein